MGMSAPSLDAHVAALTSSFAAVPAAAVPAIIDCVLASSSLHPDSLFSSLLNSFPDSTLALESNRVVSHAAALCHLTKNTSSPLDSLHLLFWKVFIPLLKLIDSNNSELFNQIIALLSDTVSKYQSWDLLEETLVPFCLRSVSLEIGLVQNDESAVYQWSNKDFMDLVYQFCQVSDTEESPKLQSLPLLTASLVLSSLLSTVLSNWRELLSTEKVQVDSLVRNLTWDLSSLALLMLRQSTEYQSCSIRVLIPAVVFSLNEISPITVTVRGTTHTLSGSSFLREAWKCCQSLFPLGNLERLHAYNILSLCFSNFSKIISKDDKFGDFDIREMKEFWEEIRKGLVDKDSSVRKQALYLLKISLSQYFSSINTDILSTADNNSDTACSRTGSNIAMTKRERWASKEAKSMGIDEFCNLGETCSNSQDRWRVFLLLYEMLDEYGAHLVEAAWTHQVALLLRVRNGNDCSSAACNRENRVEMDTLEEIFYWMAVLWDRGFSHENPQVRSLIMDSFLGIAWEEYDNFAKIVPRDFVLGPLIHGLNDVVHHKDFGVKGVYNSKTIEGATKFFRKFSCQLILSDRLFLVWSLGSAARQESFGRAGLMALSFCIASSASHPDTTNTLSDNSCTVFDARTASNLDVLEVLGIVVERSKQHFNPNYRLKVCEKVIEAVSYMINVADMPLDQLLHFLSTVPREFTDITGSLRGMVQKWIKQSCDDVSVETRSQILKELIEYPTRFINHSYSVEELHSFDDDDVSAWEAEAQRWSRMVLLVISEEQYFDLIFMFFQNYSNTLCNIDGSEKWMPIKYLILVMSLIEEFQREWRKFRSDESSAVLPSVYEKFTESMLSVLIKLVGFSRSASSLFWSVNTVQNGDLPSYIKGKLGGPSKRRLASSVTPSVLQAVYAIRSVSCVSSWCNHFAKDESLNTTFAFLWDFSWKVIQSPNLETETGAELHLAAFEALSYMLRALSATSPYMITDILISHQKLGLANGKEEPLLDSFATGFLKSINDLLANGSLTRSRRAVLMCWKWLCVESLLAIPHTIREGANHQKSSSSLFSDTTLRTVLLDIIESLENSGENSVLSILKCVRLVLALACSNSNSEAISGSSWLDSQMVMQLVSSAWILHVSCNKRRVAPIAALLSAILHPNLFYNLEMHETNATNQGPLKWFVEKLLDEGAKSPRTIRLAALHLTGLWLKYPKTAKYYIKELKFLSLYGSVAFDEDFEAELMENQEARAEVSLLAQSPDREFTEVFINTELYVRVCVAVLFYRFAKFAKTYGATEIEESPTAVHCGKLFLLELLDSAVNDKDLGKELYKKYSSVHRRKVRAWQMICVLSHFVEQDIVEQVTSKLHLCLYRNNLPSVRQYLETFAIQIYLKFPKLAGEQLIPIFHNYGMRTQALSSHVFIAANVILHTRELTLQIKHLKELLPPIIPLLTSHHHSLRGFTQLLVHCVLSKLWPVLGLDNLVINSFERNCFEDLKSYLAQNNDCARLRSSMDGFFDEFDPDISATPQGVFGARLEGSDFECVPISLMERVIDFLNEARDDLRSAVAKDLTKIKNETLSVLDSYDDNPVKDLSLDFQKKITFDNINRQIMISDFDLTTSLLEMEKEDELFNSVLQTRNQAVERIKQSQQNLILVASLLDRIPNLAGLARTCEVFKASGLAIADTSILQDKQFQLISVTAEKWLPIIEVPVSSMKAFLEKKRQEGYSIIGLEQTANSTPLDCYSFPNKTMLVLGREKEGIPVDILHKLDGCVEIPQLGIIRSLNVHVSGAIALWEYTRQQRCQKSSH